MVLYIYQQISCVASFFVWFRQRLCCQVERIVVDVSCRIELLLPQNLSLGRHDIVVMCLVPC